MPVFAPRVRPARQASLHNRPEEWSVPAEYLQRRRIGGPDDCSRQRRGHKDDLPDEAVGVDRQADVTNSPAEAVLAGWTHRALRVAKRTRSAPAPALASLWRGAGRDATALHGGLGKRDALQGKILGGENGATNRRPAVAPDAPVAAVSSSAAISARA